MCNSLSLYISVSVFLSFGFSVSVSVSLPLSLCFCLSASVSLSLPYTLYRAEQVPRTPRSTAVLLRPANDGRPSGRRGVVCLSASLCVSLRLSASLCLSLRLSGSLWVSLGLAVSLYVCLCVSLPHSVSFSGSHRRFQKRCIRKLARSGGQRTLRAATSSRRRTRSGTGESESQRERAREREMSCGHSCSSPGSSAGFVGCMRRRKLRPARNLLASSEWSFTRACPEGRLSLSVVCVLRSRNCTPLY